MTKITNIGLDGDKLDEVEEITQSKEVLIRKKRNMGKEE